MRWASGIVLTILLSTAACGRSTTPQDRMCHDLKMVADGVTNIRNLKPTATLDDLRSANRSVVDSVETLKRDAGKMKLAGVANLDKAEAALTAKIQTLPANATAASVKATLTPALSAVDRAQAALSTGLNCAVRRQ